MQEIEIWMDIEGYEGLYQVSNYGRIKSLERKVYNSRNGMQIVKEKILKYGFSGNNGRMYCEVGLCKDGKKKTTRVHRLVALHFVPNPDNLPQVNHDDNDPLNNLHTNLKWCVSRENTIHGYAFKKTSSNYPGVYWFKRVKKWRARIYINGKEIHLGYFANELEAAEAYQTALKQLTHG